MAKDAKIQKSFLKSWFREKAKDVAVKTFAKTSPKKQRTFIHTKGPLRRLRVCLIAPLNQTTRPPGGLRALTLIYHSRKLKQRKD